MEVAAARASRPRPSASSAAIRGRAAAPTARRCSRPCARCRSPSRRARCAGCPHEFSGGQRQRLMIAMALLPAARPDHRRRADHRARRDDPGADPASLLRALVKERGVSVLFTTHDLGTAYEICDRVMVMYAGQEMETAPTDAFFGRARAPLHAAAAGQPARPRAASSATSRGEVPSLIDAAAGLPLPSALRRTRPRSVACERPAPRTLAARPRACAAIIRVDAPPSRA